MTSSSVPAIVLTGTITPMVPSKGATDAKQRRLEYLEALRFYSGFGRVYLLENSGYPCATDPEFQALENCTFHDMSPPSAPSRGKGHQEFEMLDRWFQSATPPERFFKITGRYVYRNFARLMRDCAATPSCGLVIDQHPRSRRAVSSILCVRADFYRSRLAGIYAQCDDAAGRWIEHVLFEALQTDPGEVRAFRVEPDPDGICGSTGTHLLSSRPKSALKQGLRTVNRVIDPRRLWFKR